MIIQGTAITGTTVSSSAATVDADSYFNLVSLLLPGNGTNGQTNNTFLDSSTNAFTITRNGNTTQGTFSPFSQTGWSNFFDGTGDYLTLSSNTSMDFGTGNFTIEGWFYTGSKDISGGASRTIIGNSGNGYTMQLYITTSGYLNFGNTGSTFIQGSTDLADNAWHYFAIARKGTGTNEIAMWVDGVRVAQGTNSQNYTSGTIFLGSFDASNGFWNGYLSNLRIVKGTAVYDASNSTITVPTAPLTAITNTSLLTCQSNRFIDNSANAFVITVNGNVSVQPFSPFNPDAPYSTTTVGGSAYFDGSGDYLTVPDSASFDLPGDFTAEFFAYATGSNARRWFQLGDYRAGQNGILIYSTSGNAIVVYVNGAVIITGPTLVPYQWVHIACVREGAGANNLKLYVNGSLAGQVTNTTSFTGVAGNGISLGAEYGGSFAATLETYMSNVRLVKGTAVYTSAFTPPTAPLTAIANTQLLLNYTNGGITDAAAKNVLETIADAQISTAQSKFGGSSIAFDGTGDYLMIPNSQNFVFGSGDFTIEFWLRLNANNARQQIVYHGNVAGNNVAFLIELNSSLKLRFLIQTSGGQILVDSSATPSTNTWIHVACVRNGTSAYLFVDGVSQGTITPGTNALVTENTPVYIGTGLSSPLNGYIDDLRVTKGYARYTANFTPPTTAFPTQ